MKPPVVDDRSQFVEVIQKKSSSSATTSTDDSGAATEQQEFNNKNNNSSSSPGALLSLSSLEHEMNKMWNSALRGGASATASPPPTEPALMEEGEEATKAASSSKSHHPHHDDNHHEEKKDDVSDGHISATGAVDDARETTTDDEVLEEGLEAMWVEEIVSATPKAEAAAATAEAAEEPAPPLSSSNKNSDDSKNKNNYSNSNTHTGRSLRRKSFFGKKKKSVDSAAAAAQGGAGAMGSVVVKEEEVRQSLLNKVSCLKPTKVQTSIRLLENEPAELQLPALHGHVHTTASSSAVAVAAATPTTSSAAAAAAVAATATSSALETPLSRKSIFSSMSGGTTSMDTNLLMKEAALKAYTARKLLAQALSMEPTTATNGTGKNKASSSSGGGSREALAQSAFREATHARKMVESGNRKGEGALPKGLEALLREAADKGAEAVAMMQQQLRCQHANNAANVACKAGGSTDDDDDVLPAARSIEEHADRARHYLDLILPDAPGMTQAQARAAASSGGAAAAAGDEVSSLGFDNTINEEGGGNGAGEGGDETGGAADPMNLLSMSSLNEILDGPMDGPESPLQAKKHAALVPATVVALSSPLPKSTTIIKEEKKGNGGAAVADVPASSNTAKKNSDSSAAAAVPSNNKPVASGPSGDNSNNSHNNMEATQKPTDGGNNAAAVQPETSRKSKKADKKSAKKKEKKERKSSSDSNVKKKSGFFGRFRSSKAPNLSNTLSGQAGSDLAETAEGEKIKRKSRAKKAARDAIRSKRLLASITIDDGQDDDDEEEPEPEELKKVHDRIREMDDQTLKRLNDAIQADCDESVTSYDGIKMHGAPVLEVPKLDKKKSKVNKNKRGVEKLAPVVELPAPTASRMSSMRTTSFISAPAGSAALLTQASWDSLFQQKSVKQDAASTSEVAVPSSSEEGVSSSNQEDEEVEPVFSSSASCSQRLDPPQLNQAQQELRNVISKSPDSTVSHGDKYSVDQEDTMEQASEELGDMAVTENDEPKEDRYLVVPEDINTFEAFLHSCGSEIDTLCGVAVTTDVATRTVLLQEDLPRSTAVPPPSASVVPSEGVAVERGADKKMTVETADPTALATNELRDGTNNNRVRSILGRLSTKKSDNNNELNTTKSLLSSRSSRSVNGQGSSRKGLLGFFNMASSSKKDVPRGNVAAKTPPASDVAQAPVVTPEMPNKDAQVDIPVESSSCEQEMDKQLSLPLTNELGTSSESTANEISTMDKYSNANDDGPKAETKATSAEATPIKTESATPASLEKLDKPSLEAPATEAKGKEPSREEKHGGESKASAPKTEKIASIEKRNPKKEAKANGLLPKPTRATSKNETKESSKKGASKTEAKEKNKKQKAETPNTKPKAKKQTRTSTKEQSKSTTQLVVVQVVEKKRSEIPKESNDVTPFQNSSNKTPDETMVTEQPLAASSQTGPQAASTKTEDAVQAPTQLPSKKVSANKKSKKTPVPTAAEVPKSNSDTENKEDPLIALIREQSFKQNKKSRDPASVDESDPPRGIDP